MKFRKVIYVGIAIGFCTIVVCGVIIYYISQFNDVKVSFLDIGQGDAILISKGSQQILIDGGPDSTILLEQLGKQMPFWDRNIEIVIATHPDSDHTDGLIGVFENFSVDQFWHTNANKNTSVYNALLHRVQKEKNIIDVIVYNGLDAIFDEDVKLNIIYPFEEFIEMDDINDTSVGIILNVYDEVFYLGGDLSSKIEDVLPIETDITVLKASHHGSKKSTSDNFLQKTNPRDVIISAGKDNRYGHPHDETIKRVEDVSANILQTSINGTITYNCKNNECNTLTEK